MDEAGKIEAADQDGATGESGRAKPRKRMQVFRMADAQELGKDHMPFVGVDEGVMAGFGRLAQAGAHGVRGDRVVTLFSEPGENGASLTYAWFKSGYVVPRHSHSADCVYYVIAGNLTMGSATLGKGDGVFVPANDGYTFEVGPNGAEVLEFRNATHFNIHFKGNDDAHWDRIVGAMQRGGEVWGDEQRPSERRLEPAAE